MERVGWKNQVQRPKEYVQWYLNVYKLLYIRHRVVTDLSVVVQLDARIRKRKAPANSFTETGLLNIFITHCQNWCIVRSSRASLPLFTHLFLTIKLHHSPAISSGLLWSMDADSLALLSQSHSYTHSFSELGVELRYHGSSTRWVQANAAASAASRQLMSMTGPWHPDHALCSKHTRSLSLSWSPLILIVDEGESRYVLSGCYPPSHRRRWDYDRSIEISLVEASYLVARALVPFLCCTSRMFLSVLFPRAPMA